MKTRHWFQHKPAVCAVRALAGRDAGLFFQHNAQERVVPRAPWLS
jgi:hypothetical protein